MVIEKNKAVSVSYKLTVKENGGETLVEETEAKHPFVFLFGNGDLLEAFESNLKGLKVGDKFDFQIEYKSAYGERDEQNVAKIPVDVFKDEEGAIDWDLLKSGNIVPMMDNEGRRLNGVVQEVLQEELVVMDFNHPLAEKDLHFVGEVVGVRNATPDEISHGHIHGEGGHHH